MTGDFACDAQLVTARAAAALSKVGVPFVEPSSERASGARGEVVSRFDGVRLG